jgi:aromatic ring-cleaving dioxygenase
MSNAIHSYHAHIYYDVATTRRTAEALRARIDEQFVVRLGRWHDVPVGPHPIAMFQVAFMPNVFATFVPWLMLERHGLTVLVHPNTGAPRDDHMVNAFWMGGELALRADVLPLADDLSSLEMEPNTRAKL